MGKISAHAKEAGRIYHDPGREQRACSVSVDENISFVVIVIFFTTGLIWTKLLLPVVSIGISFIHLCLVVCQTSCPVTTRIL